jgi:large subunit ribosomal protein L25
MKTLELNGQLREDLGKKGSIALRREEVVPCVIYGGEKAIHFSAPLAEMKKFIYSPHVYFIHIGLDGKTYKTAMKEIQFHPVTDEILHVDFLELSDDKKVKMDLPVTVTGNSVGVRAGGKLSMNTRKLKVEALPGDMPDEVKLDISNLNIGDKLRISDLNFKGVTFLDASNVVVATVQVTRNTKAAAAEAEKK